MPNNLAVNVTADIVDLQAKFAVANATTQKLAAEMRALARQIASGFVGPTRLLQVTDDMLKSKAEAQRLAEELGKAGISVKGFGAHSEESHAHVAILAREIHSLFREASEGNAAGAGVTILALAQHLLSVSPAAMLALAGVTAFTAGLAYLGIKAYEAGKALDDMQMGAAIADNADLTREKFKGMVEAIKEGGVISESEANKIGVALSRVPNLTGQAADAVAGITPRFVEAFKVPADKMPEVWRRMLSPGTTAAEAANQISELGGHITQAQREAAEAVDRTGSRNQVLAEKLQLVDQQIQKTTRNQIANRSAVTDTASNFLTFIGAENSGLNGEQILLEGSITKWQAKSAAIHEAMAQLRKTPDTPEQSLEVGMEESKKENPLSRQLEEANAHVGKLKTGLEAAKTLSAKVKVTELTESLASANEKLQALQFGPVLERMRADMAKVAATWEGTQTGMLQRQRAVAEQTLVSMRNTLGAQATANKEYINIQEEISRLDVQIRRSSGEDIINATRQTNQLIAANTQLTSIERLTLERANLQKLLDAHRVSGQQLVQIQNEVAEKTVEINNQTEERSHAIARSDVDTKISIERMHVEATRENLTAELSLHRAHVAQVYAQLRQLTTEENALDIQQLENERSQYNEQSADYARLTNQIKQLREKLNLDLAKLGNEETAAAKREAEEQAQAWRKVDDEIGSAESTMLQSLLSKRASFAQAGIKAVGQLVDHEIIADARAMTTRLLIRDQGLAKQKALEEGGVLFHAHIAAEEATQTTATEAQKVAAVSAGSQAQVHAQQIAQAEGKSAQSAADSGSIMSAAGTAAANVYKSVASIPYVGWILAPVAAIAAFAAVAAYKAFTSFDVGSWQVPEDMPAQVHKGEMVIPATHASSLRSAIGKAGDFSSLVMAAKGSSGAIGLEVGAWNIPSTMTATLHEGEAVVPKPFAAGLRESGVVNGVAGGDTYGDTNIHNHFHQPMVSTDLIMAHFERAVRNGHPVIRKIMRT
jgi:hypothetical protein